MAKSAVKNRPVQVEVDPASVKDFEGMAENFIGQKIAVLCARYQYRGKLTAVASDCILLANARSVEISGPSNSDTPEREDDIGTTVCIKNDAIELFYQPQWVHAPLADEDN